MEYSKKIIFILMTIILVLGSWTDKKIFAQLSEAQVVGHLIKVDKRIDDWFGAPPLKENESVISEGEFIFKDAKGDDTGAGNYTYPTNEAFKRCADLREFRVTFDEDNLYLLIRFNKPGQSWVPYCLIGIDQDGAGGGKGGTVVLTEGDLDFISENEGAYGELKVAPELACEYVVSIFSCSRGRIWDAEGRLVARRDGKGSDTPGFSVNDVNMSSVEVAIPQKIIGNPAGKTWRFIVATGLEEYGRLREMADTTTEWHGGGGIGTGDEGEVDPDIYDLASSSKAIQEKELSSFDSSGKLGDEKAFATIKESYLIVKFGGREKIIKKEEAVKGLGCLYGLFMSNLPINLPYINSFETKSGKKAGTIMFFYDWSSDFSAEDCQAIVDYGAVPFITWEPWLINDKDKIYLDNIISGEWNDYIISWAEEAKDWGKPFFLRWGHEMNGNWYPWSGAKNNNDPSKYIKAYRHIHGIFKKVGATNVIWIWSPMNEDIPSSDWNKFSNYYPGDEYVDWLGIDGFNWGTSQVWGKWVSFQSIFKPIYNEFRKLYPDKPIMICEFASSEEGGDKAEWVKSTLETLETDFSKIKAIVWFNIKKECDWRLDSSQDVFKAFKEGIANPYFRSNPKEFIKLTE